MAIASIPHYTPQRLLTFILSFALLAASACGAANDKNYFPLADGAKWEYSGRASSSTGKQIDFRATARVEGETLINGKRYFKHITSSNLSSVPEAGKGIESVRYYRVADDGIYFLSGGDPNRPELLEMPLPIPIGTKWLSGQTEVQAERAGVLTIGGNEYRDCLKITYKQQGVSQRVENYLAPRVGVVKVVNVNDTEPKSTVELTLESYKP